MTTTVELNEREKALVWETLNKAAQFNQQNATTTGDKFRKDFYKSQNETLLNVAALFAPGFGKTTISKEG